MRRSPSLLLLAGLALAGCHTSGRAGVPIATLSERRPASTSPAGPSAPPPPPPAAPAPAPKPTVWRAEYYEIGPG